MLQAHTRARERTHTHTHTRVLAHAHTANTDHRTAADIKTASLIWAEDGLLVRMPIDHERAAELWVSLNDR